MDIDVQPGKYVVAVSGGVDSVTLLHLLVQKGPRTKGPVRSWTNSNLDPGPWTLTIAHFDHGIRDESVRDRQLVQKLAQDYGLSFVYHVGKLGPNTSEAVAREARYQFLHEVRRSSGAQAIITAHHQDDVLETVLLNLLRGTSRRGLSSLKNTDVVRRPLLTIPKADLLAYAKSQGLLWREDSTNADPRYLRNYIRLKLLPRFSPADKQALFAISRRSAELNAEIENQTTNLLHLQPSPLWLNRHQFILLPHAVARELLAEWLLVHASAELSRQLLERLVVAAKTGRNGTKVDIDARYWLVISRDMLGLNHKS